LIILDFETNTTNEHDVIEVAAVKVELRDDEFVILDKFHRYYLSRYPVNPYSFEVHKITPQMVLAYRREKNLNHSVYFKEDLDFIDFCKGATTLVAHNISFELRHLYKLVTFQNHFCTMKQNRQIVKVCNKNGSIKNPKLDETCRFYGIDFDEDSYHSATYDVSKTYEILKAMKKNGYL